LTLICKFAGYAKRHLKQLFWSSNDGVVNEPKLWGREI